MCSHHIKRVGTLSDIDVLKPHHHQNHSGSLFGFLDSILRKEIPFLVNYVLSEDGNFARNIAGNFGNLPIIKNSKRNYVKSLKNIGKRIMNGGSKVRKYVKGVMRRDMVKKKTSCQKQKKISVKMFFHINLWITRIKRTWLYFSG